MPRPDADLILRLQPTLLRRSLGVGFLALMAVVMGLAAISMRDAGLMPRAIALALAVFGAVQARRLWLASAGAVELREDGLHCTRTARILARLEDIARVDGSAMLLKPASGFILRLKEKQPFARSTGMWWIFGDRLAIGGATPKAEGKAMASALTELLRARDIAP